MKGKDFLMDNSIKSFSRRNWLILLLFGLIGQIAWSVENMFFNVFVWEDVAPSLDTVTLMVQLSGIAATLVTLIAGTVSDKVGNRRSFISLGYIIWGVSVALFGCITPGNISAIFGTSEAQAVGIALTLVVVGDCVMTLFGSTANDAAYNAWVTDNTAPAYRGRVESAVAILPLIAMLIVAGGLGILKDTFGFSALFIGLGAVITLAGIVGLLIIKDAPKLERSGGMRDIVFGFRPSVVKENLPFYATLLAILLSGIACQVFMPYLIIFMSTYLGFTTLEYSAVFAVAILGGAAVNIYLGKLSDKMRKSKLLYVAAGILALGLFVMYFASMIKAKIALMLLFGIGGFIMICGNIFCTSLGGSILRDNTPEGSAGKMQGVRMVASVLIPMLAGPALGNAINKAQGILMTDPGADIMTTEYIPAPEIFLAGALVALVMYAAIPLIVKSEEK